MDLVGKSLGKYQITGRLGAGGMGVVYRAFHPGLEVHVALKALAPDALDDPTALARFRRESQVLARLRHPGVVAVQDSDTFEGIPFYVMPLIEDPTLERELEAYAGRNETYPVDRALALTVSLLEVLGAVHAAEIIHRDIKPANIFVGARGQAMLADFGLARGRNDTSLTRTGAAVGTLLWMAPEQLEGGEQDARTDLYQAGLVLYRLLEGRLPFADDVTDTVKSKCIEPALRPIQRADVPAAVTAAVARLTARRAADRYPDARSASEALRAATQPSRARQPRTAPLTARPPTVTAPTPAPRRRALGAVAALLALVLAATGVRAAWRRKVTPPVESASAATPPRGSTTPREPDVPAATKPWAFRKLASESYQPGAGLHSIAVTWPGAPAPRAAAALDVMLSTPRGAPGGDAQLIEAARSLHDHVPLDLRGALPAMKLHLKHGDALVAFASAAPRDAAAARRLADALIEVDELAFEAQQTLTMVRGGPRLGLWTRLGMKLEALVIQLGTLYPGFIKQVEEPTRLELRQALAAQNEASRGTGKIREFMQNARSAVESLNRIDERIGKFLREKR